MMMAGSESEWTINECHRHFVLCSCLQRRLFCHVVLTSKTAHSTDRALPPSRRSTCDHLSQSIKQASEETSEEKTSQDAVAISPLPPYYHRRVQRRRRRYVGHPKDRIRKGEAKRRSDYRHPVFQIRWSCWSIARTTYLDVLTFYPVPSLPCCEHLCALKGP